MKLIPLTQGKFAQVDDWNYDRLMRHKWYAYHFKNMWYVRRNEWVNKKEITIMMHREIMNTPKGMVVDHIDHNGLNCLEENMRNCSVHQNNMNKTAIGKSKYLGVHYDTRNRITSSITVNYTRIFLGYFKTEEEAAKAYDKAAKEHHKEFANLNFK